MYQESTLGWANDYPITAHLVIRRDYRPNQPMDPELGLDPAHFINPSMLHMWGWAWPFSKECYLKRATESSLIGMGRYQDQRRVFVGKDIFLGEALIYNRARDKKYSCLKWGRLVEQLCGGDIELLLNGVCHLCAIRKESRLITLFDHLNMPTKKA